jgi:hypothetical protein
MDTFQSQLAASIISNNANQQNVALLVFYFDCKAQFSTFKFRQRFSLAALKLNISLIYKNANFGLYYRAYFFPLTSREDAQFRWANQSTRKR